MAPLDLLLTANRLDYVASLLEDRHVAVFGGHGWEGAHARGLGAASVLFIDPSPVRGRWVERRMGAQGVDTWIADPARTAQPDGAFDVVIGVGLPVGEDQRRALLAEWRRILHPEGFLYLILPGPAPFGLRGAPNPGLPEAELRAELRRRFPHVELLTQRLFLGADLGPAVRGAPTWIEEGQLGDGAATLAVCSQLLIVPEEVGMSLEGMGSLLDAGRRAAARGRRKLRAALAALDDGPDPQALLEEAEARHQQERARLEADAQTRLSAVEADARAQAAALEETLSQRGAELEALRAQLTARDAEASALKGEVSALTQRLEAGASRPRSLKADLSAGGPQPAATPAEARVPDEIWSPPGIHGAPPRPADRGEPLWSRMLDAVAEPAADTAWATPQEGGRPAPLPHPTLSLEQGPPPMAVPRPIPSPRADGGRLRRRLLDDDDRPQEGELALLSAISAANLDRLPQVTEEADS